MLNKFIEELKSKFSKKSEKEELVNDVPKDGTADPKQNQISMLIRIVVVLGLAYLAYDQFLNPQPEETAPIAVQANPKVKKVPENVSDSHSPSNLSDNSVQNEENPPSMPSEVNPMQPSVESEASAPTIPEQPSLPEPTASSEEVLSRTETTNTIDTMNSQESSQPQETKLVEEKASSSLGIANENTKVDELIDQMDKKTPTIDLTKKIEESVTEKIDPPRYDKIGRGLVYNCLGKHWSCVDKSSYLICNKNMKFNQANVQKAECVVKNVYASEEDCQKIQAYNTSHNAVIDFCQ